MSRYSRRNRFLPILLITVVVIIAIIALVSLARAVFFSGGSGRVDERQQQLSLNREALLSTTSGSAVRMTVRGPIVADENFHSYRIIIEPDARAMTTYSGYLEQQVETVELSNNTAAYEEFVNALDKANLAAGVPFPEEQDSTSGICATGRLYEFEILRANSVVTRLWTSTCKGSPGSLVANSGQLGNLFYRQIPNSKDLIKGVKL